MLYLVSFIEQHLQKASYEYDPETRVWCAWTKQLPGAYAQGHTVEEARQQLAEVIEDYLIVSLQKGEGDKLLNKMKKTYAAPQASF